MKASTVFTVKNFSPAPQFKQLDTTTYEVPGTGQEVVAKFRKGLAKGAVAILRGFFVGEEKKFIPVDLNLN